GTGECAENCVIPNRTRGAWKLQRKARTLREWHRAAKRHIFDVESRGNAGGRSVEAEVDTHRADVVDGPKLAIRPIGRGISPPLDQDRRVGGVDAVEVRGSDAAV